MSLLLLLKPHPRRAGRGQELVIQRGGKLEEEQVFIQPAEAKQVSQVPDEVISGLAKLGFKDLANDKKLVESLKKSYKQAEAEGVSLEDMVLLYMMTER